MQTFVMELPTKQQIKTWLKRQNISREDFGKMLGVGKSRVDCWLSTADIPIQKHFEIARIIEKISLIVPSNFMKIFFDEKEMKSIKKAMTITGNINLSEFIVNATTSRSRELLMK